MEEVIKSYENYREEDRLTTNNARKTEFITTIRAFEELFPPGVKVLDCAAGTGAYAFYLAEKGFDVTATDITPRHIQYIHDKLKDKTYAMQTGVMDARDLHVFEDESFDIVLNMGPYYHLTEKKDREKCINECLRVLKKGGLLVTTYISRLSAFTYVVTSDASYLKEDFGKQLYQTGALKHDDPYCFWTDTYYALPEEMEQAYTNKSLTIVDHFAQDGVAPLMRSVVDQWDESQFKEWCAYHYMVCREKSILGSSGHGAIVGRK